MQLLACQNGLTPLNIAPVFTSFKTLLRTNAFKPGDHHFDAKPDQVKAGALLDQVSYTP